MKIKSNRGNWYDETGRKLSQEEIEIVQASVLEDIDERLSDTGFEGLMKKIVSKYLGKRGFVFTVDSEVEFDEEVVGLDNNLTDLIAEIQDLDDDITELSKKLEEAIAEREKLIVKRDRLTEKESI
ncbi:hypothetical protein [Streptococcus henryi]|uniref:hypothetical protein n=1 Tax=Streptococcus henryi TaxID=439219 RepID=UPI00036DFDCF|nr:hypothetical protein [Streptococcus henryi]